MKKENLKYVWLAIFVTMVCTIITCQSDDSSEASIEVEEAPIEFIPPVDTLERKEFYDQNDWKYDETVPSEDEDGQD